MNETYSDNSREMLISENPVTVRRRVRWSECDPAQVVYSGNFFEYGASAYYWFSEVVLRRPGLAPASFGTDMPMKAAGLEFFSRLRPEDWFVMSVFVTDVRTRTFDILVVGDRPDGKRSFLSRLSPIVVVSDTGESTPIPGPIREALLAYRDRCPHGGMAAK